MTPPSPNRDEFFVGWSGQLGSATRRAILPAGLAALFGIPALGAMLGRKVDDPAGPDFASLPSGAALADLPIGMTATGLLLRGPYPLLHLPGDSNRPRGRTLFLSGDGKRGPDGITPEMYGHLIAVDGFVLRRGALEMLVTSTPPRLVDAPAPPAPAAEALGRWRVTGEICDGKCGAGAMRPGIGLAHRACATLCLDGDLPAVFVPSGPIADHPFLLLADRAGNSPMPAFRDLIGRRVTLEGEVERFGDLPILRAERP